VNANFLSRISEEVNPKSFNDNFPYAHIFTVEILPIEYANVIHYLITKSMSSGLGEAGPWAGGIPGFDGVYSPAPSTFMKSAPNGGPGLSKMPWFDLVISEEVEVSLLLLVSSFLVVLLHMWVFLHMWQESLCASVTSRARGRNASVPIKANLQASHGTCRVLSHSRWVLPKISDRVQPLNRPAQWPLEML
jgi:hypothetical protein